MAKPLKPDPPTIAERSAESITVTWLIDASVGQYILRVQDEAGSRTEYLAIRPPFVIGRLAANGYYELTLEAENADGRSGESDALGAWTGLPRPTARPIAFRSPRDLAGQTAALVAVGWDVSGDASAIQHVENVSVELGRLLNLLTPVQPRVIGRGKLRDLLLDVSAPVGQLQYALRFRADNPRAAAPVVSEWGPVGELLRPPPSVDPTGPSMAPGFGNTSPGVLSSTSVVRKAADDSGGTAEEGDSSEEDSEEDNLNDGDQGGQEGESNQRERGPPDIVDPRNVHELKDERGRSTGTFVENRGTEIRIVSKQEDGTWKKETEFFDRRDEAARDRAVRQAVGMFALTAKVPEELRERSRDTQRDQTPSGGAISRADRVNYFDREERSTPISLQSRSMEVASGTGSARSPHIATAGMASTIGELVIKYSGAGLGGEITQKLANKYVETGNPVYLGLGLLTNLWTPETALNTALNIPVARAISSTGVRLAKSYLVNSPSGRAVTFKVLSNTWNLIKNPRIKYTWRSMVWDPRSWKAVSQQYWRGTATNYGLDLHHWLAPRTANWIPSQIKPIYQGISNAGINLVEIPASFNRWMGGYALREWSFRITVFEAGRGMYGLGQKAGNEIDQYIIRPLWSDRSR